MEIFEIEESFINFCDVDTTPCAETDASCVDVVGACIPMYAVEDLHFQVLLNNFTGLEVDLILGGQITFNITLARTCDDCVTDTFMALLTAKPWKASGTDMYDYIVLTLDTWLDTTPFNPIEDGGCFVLCLWKQYLGDYTKLGCSPCFIKYPDKCDTSVIYYRNNETSMGFYNNGDSFYETYFNSIRLPFRLHRPQTRTKKNVYRLSNGNYIKNSASKSREWVGETDMMSEKWHMKLDIALDHDNIRISNTNSGMVAQFAMSEADDNYNVDWQEFLDYPHAKAEFKLLEMPFLEFNNNCNLTPLNPSVNVNAILTDDFNLLIWG